MDIDGNAPVITRDEIVIQAPLGKVWDLFTDISAWPEWQKEIERASLTGPIAVGSVIYWKTAGLDIASTIAELVPLERIAWSGSVQDIIGVHVWQFSEVDGGVLVHTEESWNGEPVRLQHDFIQQALNRSIRSWLESLKQAVEKK